MEEYTKEEQKKIFGYNLSKYVNLSRKQQNEIAKDLGINPTTFNMWCGGKSMPDYATIRKLSSYFNAYITQLTDRNAMSDIKSTVISSLIECDEETILYFEKIKNLDSNQKKIIFGMIDQMIN